MKARDAFVDVAGLLQPRPAPRFSGTVPADPASAPANGQDTRAVLTELGYESERVDALLRTGAVAQA